MKYDNLVIRTVRGWLHRLVRYLSPPPVKQLPTTMEWLRDRLESTALERWKTEGKITESDYWLSPFEAGVLFSDKPIPWVGSVDMWKADFGTLYLRVPRDLMDLSNENKMSDGRRDRASLGVTVWKSYQKWSVRRSAVRSIVRLGDWRPPAFANVRDTVQEVARRSLVRQKKAGAVSKPMRQHVGPQVAPPKKQDCQE